MKFEWLRLENCSLLDLKTAMFSNDQFWGKLVFSIGSILLMIQFFCERNSWKGFLAFPKSSSNRKRSSRNQFLSSSVQGKRWLRYGRWSLLTTSNSYNSKRRSNKFNKAIQTRETKLWIRPLDPCPPSQNSLRFADRSTETREWSWSLTMRFISGPKLWIEFRLKLKEETLQLVWWASQNSTKVDTKKRIR